MDATGKVIGRNLWSKPGRHLLKKRKGFGKKLGKNWEGNYGRNWDETVK